MAFFGRPAPPPSRLEELKRALLREPGSRQFLALAEEFRKEGDYAEAIRTIEQGLHYHPGYVAAHVALGRINRETGRVDDALRSFLNALKIDRENLVAIKQAAIVYLEKGEKVEAVKKFKLYRGLNPGDKEVSEQIEKLDVELGTTSRVPSPSRPAVLPLPAREATQPFFLPPPVPAAGPAVQRPPLPPTVPPAPPRFTMEPGQRDEPPPDFSGSDFLPPVAPVRLPPAAEPFPASGALPPPSRTAPVPRVEDPGLDITYDSLPAAGPAASADQAGAAPAASEADVFVFEVEMERVSEEEVFRARPAASPAAKPAEAPGDAWDEGDRAAPGSVAPLHTEPAGAEPAPGTGGPQAREPGGLVTETLAELYLAQGLRAEARSVYETLAATEVDSLRAADLREKADRIGREDAREAEAAAALSAADPRIARLREFARRVARTSPDDGDLNGIVDGLVRGRAGIEAAVVTETGGVTVVTAGPFGATEESLAAELAAFWKNLQRGSDEMEAGAPSLVSLVTDAGGAVVSGIGSEYALVLRVASGAPMGRARYEATRAAFRLRPLLV